MTGVLVNEGNVDSGPHAGRTPGGHGGRAAVTLLPATETGGGQRALSSQQAGASRARLPASEAPSPGLRETVNTRGTSFQDPREIVTEMRQDPLSPVTRFLWGNWCQSPPWTRHGRRTVSSARSHGFAAVGRNDAVPSSLYLRTVRYRSAEKGSPRSRHASLAGPRRQR